MKAIVVTDQAAGTAGMKLVERPDPDAARPASLSRASYASMQSTQPAWASRVRGTFSTSSASGPRTWLEPEEHW